MCLGEREDVVSGLGEARMGSMHGLQRDVLAPRVTFLVGAAQVPVDQQAPWTGHFLVVVGKPRWLHKKCNTTTRRIHTYHHDR